MLTLAAYLRRRLRALSLRRGVGNVAARMMEKLLAHEAEQGAAERAPACFGKRFGAATDAACAACDAQVMCLHRCAHATMLGSAAQGQSQGVYDVAARLDLEPDNVRLLQQACAASQTLPPARINSRVPEDDVPEPNERWPRRFLSERQRLPILKKLPAGTQLVRPYKGEVYVVHLQDGHYLLRGKRYPTLYAVAMAIAGCRQFRRSPTAPDRVRSMGNFSAKAFFMKSIEEALPAL